jgi:hypothetical protein
MNEKFSVETVSDYENRKQFENKIKNIIAIAQNNLQDKYPNLRLEFRAVQDMPNSNNLKQAFMFDLWMEPLIIEQKPTTITSLELNEKAIIDLVEKSIAQYLIGNCMTKLTEKYPDVQIKFKGTGLGNLYYFNVSSPTIIPADGVSDYPEDTLAIPVLDEKQLVKELIVLLESYKKANSK